MHPCAADAFEWIQAGREEVLARDKPDWKNSVFNLIPRQFEAYAKILHQIDASYKIIDNPLTDNRARDTHSKNTRLHQAEVIC
jgi:hypothetical protein